MNSPTITMERTAALAKLESYERAMDKNPDLAKQIDRDVMRGYKLLAQGKRLIDVNKAIAHGGLNLAGLPRLAIASACATESTFEQGLAYRVTAEYPNGAYFETGGGTYTFGERFSRVRDSRKWRLPNGTFTGKISSKTAKALTPFIPLPLRPRHNLSNYFLLWEANWHPAPPVDPYLLRPVTGSLMEILAEWDVSPLELAAVSAAMAKASA